MGPRDPDLIEQRDLGLRSVRTIWRGDGGAEQSDPESVQSAGGNGSDLQRHYAWPDLHPASIPGSRRWLTSWAATIHRSAGTSR